jgi:hypothetical protein
LARVFSLALILAVCSTVFGQAFGRFGYVEEARAPGFVVTREGFRVRHESSDMIRYDAPRPQWRPLSTSEHAQVVGLGEGARVPSKLRVDLLNPGFSLYYASGFRLRLRTLQPPYLSWREGSVGPDVPTPETKWVALSFRDSQPPVLLVFQDTPASVQLTGKAGDWVLQTKDLYQGWVRVVAPAGDRAWPTHTAGDLGRLVKLVLAEEDVWTAPQVSAVSREVVDEPTGIVCTWKFDRPGAIVPPAAVLASFGGHAVRLLSQTRRLEGHNEEGPVTILQEAELKVRFPIRRVPTGRALAVGIPPPVRPESGDALDAAMHVGLRLMLAARGAETRSRADELVAAFVGAALYALEPFTGQKLPFMPDGTGLDAAAAHALLMQAIYTSERATSEPNSLLTSVVWRRDWNTWLLDTPDPAVQRRAGSFAALAGALCPEPERRLEGALFQAGLAAQRGLNVWKRRRGLLEEEPRLLEVLEPLRAAVFSLEGVQTDTGFLRALQSDLRFTGADSAWIERKGDELVLVWGVSEAAPSSLILTSAYPIQVEPLENLANLETSEALGFTQVRYRAQGKGLCRARLVLPPWAPPLPQAAPLPSYSEHFR